MPEKNLSRPEVTVHVPRVNLRLEDLVFLRSLINPDRVHCHVSEKIKNRLRMLNLIGRAKVPVPAIVVVEVLRETKTSRARLDDAIFRADWGAVVRAANELAFAKRRLEPDEGDVLTEDGKQLLENGEIRVKIRKSGCL